MIYRANSVAYGHLLFSNGVRPPSAEIWLRPARSAMPMRAQNWGTYKRILIRPEPGFYVMRLRSGAPLVPAVIYQICPMVIPEPTTVTGPHPDDWCRPLDRSPRFAARIDGKRVDVELVWTARSLRRVSRDEFDFRDGPLRRWARSNPTAPEAQPHRPVDLTTLPPLF
jgi:hypothetical protein